jgi:hypothetical protein
MKVRDFMLSRMRQLDWGLLIVIFLPLIALLPTLGDGIPAAADVEVHIHRIHALNLALQDGNLWPRWISYLHLGYGYPIFNFYAPGYAYITAILELLGLPIVTAYHLVQSLAWVIGSVGMYKLAQRFLPNHAAVLAAALWVFAPSRLYEVWWQGSLAQIVAASLIPYLLLGIIKNAKEPSLRAILSIALPYAGLILSHTPMMYISSLYAGVLAAFAPIVYCKTQYNQFLRRWLYIGAGFVLGIGLAAIFLIPILFELRYVNIASGVSGTVNYLVEQFLPINEIFVWPRMIDSTDLYLNFPRSLGLVGGILSGFGIIALAKRKQYLLAVTTGIGLLFTVFMLLDISLPVWLAIPGFANLRFPERLLRIGAVLIGLSGGASMLLLPRQYQKYGMLIGLIAVIMPILPISQPYNIWLKWDNISAYDEILHEQEDRTWGTVSYDEFNPIWGERIFLDVPTNPERYAEDPFHLRVFGRDIAALNWQGLSEENITPNTLQIVTDEARAVRFRQYYFPGWRVTVNGEIAEIYPDEEIGLITVDLPAGEHIVTLDYVGTDIQRFATLISLISVVIVIGLYTIGKPTPAETPESHLIEPRFGVGIIVCVVLFAVINDSVIQPGNWLNYQSPPTEPRSMQTRVDVNFGDEVTLLGYTLHDETIAANQALSIDLYWHVPEAIANNYRPIVQIINLNQSEAWATSSRLQPAAGETSTFPPNRFARDPYTLRLISEDTAPFVGQLMIQMIGEDGSLTLADGSDRLILEPIIRIRAGNSSVSSSWDEPFHFGDIAELRCITVNEENEDIVINLLWNFISTPRQELVVMVHGLDSEEQVVENGDGAPFNGDYPSIYWHEGQTLFERRRLPANAALSDIAVGLYTRETIERLPVTQNGHAIPNNQVVVTLTENSCSR